MSKVYKIIILFFPAHRPLPRKTTECIAPLKADASRVKTMINARFAMSANTFSGRRCESARVYYRYRNIYIYIYRYVCMYIVSDLLNYELESIRSRQTNGHSRERNAAFDSARPKLSVLSYLNHTFVRKWFYAIIVRR